MNKIPAESQETPAEAQDLMGDYKVPERFTPQGSDATQMTVSADFEKIKEGLSEKPLKRPPRTRPVRDLTNDQLRRIATIHRPPPEWFIEDEERPF